MNIGHHNLFEDLLGTPARGRRRSARPVQAEGKSTVRRSALALALTVVIGYGALALLLLAWPGLEAGFMKALFDGLDLFHMQTGPDFLSFPYSLYLLVGTIAFLAGAVFLYSVIRNKLLR